MPGGRRRIAQSEGGPQEVRLSHLGPERLSAEVQEPLDSSPVPASTDTPRSDRAALDVVRQHAYGVPVPPPLPPLGANTDTGWNGHLGNGAKMATIAAVIRCPLGEGAELGVGLDQVTGTV